MTVGLRDQSFKPKVHRPICSFLHNHYYFVRVAVKLGKLWQQLIQGQSGHARRLQRWLTSVSGGTSISFPVRHTSLELVLYGKSDTLFISRYFCHVCAFIVSTAMSMVSIEPPPSPRLIYSTRCCTSEMAPLCPRASPTVVKVLLPKLATTPWFSVIEAWKGNKKIHRLQKKP